MSDDRVAANSGAESRSKMKLAASSRRLRVSPSILSDAQNRDKDHIKQVSSDSAIAMVKSIVAPQSSAVTDTQTPEKRQQRRLEEKKRLQKRAALVGDLRPASRLKPAADKSIKNSASQQRPTAIQQSESREDYAAFEYSLRAVNLISEARRESRELKLRRAFSLPVDEESKIRARVVCTRGVAFFKDLLRRKAKSLDRNPVYSRSSFLSPESYDSWKLAEKQRIDAAKTRLKFLSDGSGSNTAAQDSVARIWIKIVYAVFEARGLQSRAEASEKSFLSKVANATFLSGRAHYEPYVVIKFGEKQKFETQKLNVSNPTWNEEFIIDIPLGSDDPAQEIRISVKHQVTGYPDVKLGQIVLKLGDVKTKNFQSEDWFDLDKPDRKSKRRRSSSSSQSRSDRESSAGDVTLAESRRGELKLSYAFVALQGIDSVAEVAPFEENFNKLYKLTYDKLVVADNAPEIRPFAHKLRESRSRASSTSSTGSAHTKDVQKTVKTEEDDLADSLSDDSAEEDQPNRLPPSTAADKSKTRESRGSSLRQSEDGINLRFNLSEVSQSILDDFADIFCVPKHFADLCLLEVLGKYGDSTEHLQHINRILETYSATASRLFSESELAAFEKAKSDIKTFIEGSLETFTTTFEKKPAEDNPSGTAFFAAIKLFSFFHRDDADLRLRSTIKVAASKHYEASKVSHNSTESDVKAEQQQAQQPFQRQLRSLLLVMDDCVDFIDDFVLYFAHGYPESTNAVLTAVSTFVSSLSADLTTFYKDFDSKATIKDTSDLLVLLQKIAYIANSWSLYFPGVEKRFGIYPFVEKHIVSWIDEMDANLYKWTLNSQIVDDFKPIGPEVLHSNSVVDLFSAVSLALDYLKPILSQWQMPSVYDFFDRFIDSVAKTATKFCQRIGRDIAASVLPFVAGATNTSASASFGGVTVSATSGSVTQFFAGLFHRKPQETASHAPMSPSLAQQKFNISAEICVKMNNVETCRIMLNEFATQIAQIYCDLKVEPSKGKKMSLDDFARYKFGDSLKAIKETLDHQLLQISSTMGLYLETELFSILKVSRDSHGRTSNLLVSRPLHPATATLSSAAPDTQLEPLFEYMNDQLGLLSNQVYQSLFKRLLKQIWSLLMRSCFAVGAPATFSRSHAAQSLLKPEQVALLLSLQEPLRSFFNADGDGIPDKILRSDIESQKAFYGMYHLRTDDLIQKYAADAAQVSSDPKKTEIIADRCNWVLNLLDIRGAAGDSLAESFVEKRRAQSSH